MAWDVVIFYMIAAVSVLAALGVVAARNPVHSGIFLIICFVNVAGIFVMLGAEFLAVIQIIVYTGAVLALIIFVMMLIDPDELPSFHSAAPMQRYLSFGLGLILLLEVGAAILTRTAWTGRGEATPEAIAEVGGNTQALGLFIYTKYLLAFEITSLVLTVGVIGAVVLALPERLGERAGTRRGTISLSHTRGTDDALPAGPQGETPIYVNPDRTPPPPSATREIIKTKDPDAHTRVGLGPSASDTRSEPND